MLQITMNDENDLIEWIIRLINRFKKFNNIIFQSLLIQRYTIRDIVNHRELRKYAQKIIQTAKDVDMNFQNQLNLIYNDIDVNVRADIMRCSKKKWFSTNYSLNSISLNSIDELKLESFKKKWIKVKITKFNLLLNKNLATIRINNHLINIQTVNINDCIKTLIITSSDCFIKTNHLAIQILFIKLFNIYNFVKTIKADNQSITQIIKIIKTIKIIMINSQSQIRNLIKI